MARKLTKSDHLAKNVKRKSQLLKKIDKDTKKQNRHLQCDCIHTDDHGRPTVHVLNQNGPNGEVVLQCRSCEKRILINKISPTMLSESVKIVSSGLDTIKMKLNINKKDDVKCANMISPIQYFLENQFSLLYAATQKDEQKYRESLPSSYGVGTLERNSKR